MIRLATIGYEGASLADFIFTLKVTAIERVIDVREVAQSRRSGFSKTALRLALAEADIDYHHVRQLGDPKPGREAARAGDYPLFREIFYAHLDLPASRAALNEAVSLASSRTSALVCFERDPKHCHRTIVAQQMAAICPITVTNIGVQSKTRDRVGGNVAATDRLVGAC